jgi:hypothetical protein
MIMNPGGGSTRTASMSPRTQARSRGLAVLLAALPFLAGAQEPKGIWPVCAGTAAECIVWRQNHPAASKRASTAATGAEASDLDLHYRYSGPEGTGKEALLKDGATLRSGDRFTIRVEPHRERWLYLFHFDAAGQLNELVSLSGHSNRLEPGQPFTLPAADAHFTLDRRTGWETIDAIVSPQPLDGLQAEYRSRLADRRALARYAAKGLVIERDDASGRTLACQAGVGACRDTFRIHHVPALR